MALELTSSTTKEYLLFFNVCTPAQNTRVLELDCRIVKKIVELLMEKSGWNQHPTKEVLFILLFI